MKRDLRIYIIKTEEKRINSNKQLLTSMESLDKKISFNFQVIS